MKNKEILVLIQLEMTSTEGDNIKNAISPTAKAEEEVILGCLKERIRRRR
jgi:hypothetical protein